MDFSFDSLADYEEKLKNLIADSSAIKLNSKLTKLSSKKTITFSELNDSVPYWLITLAFISYNPYVYDKLLETFNDSKKTSSLKNLKALLEKHFPSLLNDKVSKAYTDHIENSTEEKYDSSEDDDLLEEPLNKIDGLAYIPSYIGDPPNLIPLVRILFTKNNNVLLDSTLDWDDIFLLVERLLQIIQSDLKRSYLMKDQIQLSENRIPERLQQINNSITHIEKYLSEYNIQVPDSIKQK